jgi:Leucine-rich repeat (LRR) protein
VARGPALDPTEHNLQLWGHKKADRFADDELTGIANLRRLSKLVICQQPITRLPAIHPDAPLEELSLLDCAALTSLAGIEKLTRVNSVLLDDLPGLDVETAFKQLSRLPGLTSLELRGPQWHELPKSAARLSKLQWLHLRDCTAIDLESVCTVLRSTRTLKRLTIEPVVKRFDVALPSEIGKLTSLEELDAARVISVPDEIGDLGKLETLVLRSGTYRSVPRTIRQLQKLKRLELSSKVLRDLPDEICELTELAELSVSGKVAELPANVGALSALRALNVRYTPLKTLPSSIRQLDKLTSLRVHDNTAIPDVVYKLPLTETEGPFDRAKLAPPSSIPGKKYVLIQNINDVPGDLVITKELAVQTEDTPPLNLLATAHALEVLELWSRESERVLAALPSPERLDRLSLWSVPCPALGRFTNLTSLHVATKRASRLPKSLAACTRLEALHLALAGLEEVPPLDALSALRSLWLSNVNSAKVKGLANFAKPPGLVKVTLDRMTNLDLGAWCSWLSSRPLTSLSIRECPLEELPAELGRLTRLEELVIEGTTVREIPDAIGAVTALTHLQIESPQLASVSPELQRCTKLERVIVSEDAPIVPQLKKRLPPGGWRKATRGRAVIYAR